MNLVEAVEMVKELTEYLCLDIKTVWDEHIDDCVKNKFSYEEIKNAILNISA